MPAPSEQMLSHRLRITTQYFFKYSLLVWRMKEHYRQRRLSITISLFFKYSLLTWRKKEHYEQRRGKNDTGLCFIYNVAYIAIQSSLETKFTDGNFLMFWNWYRNFFQLTIPTTLWNAIKNWIGFLHFYLFLLLWGHWPKVLLTIQW